VDWAEEVLSQFSTADDVTHRHIDLFRERKLCPASASASLPSSEDLHSGKQHQVEKWNYDDLKEMLANIMPPRRIRSESTPLWSTPTTPKRRESQSSQK
jgi:hypothetical protein